MSIRDKMIEVILDGDMPMVAAKMSKSGEAENVEYVPLHKTVDRLIAAGFGLGSETPSNLHQSSETKSPQIKMAIGPESCIDYDALRGEVMKTLRRLFAKPIQFQKRAQK